ncbi:MAG: hypothetical protein ACD_54C00631G0001 [uncultured bacterium]|nr:MAG: hypothetical protein ACD_54C00631G0001 [uncultured bacterium]
MRGGGGRPDADHRAGQPRRAQLRGSGDGRQTFSLGHLLNIGKAAALVGIAGMGQHPRQPQPRQFMQRPPQIDHGRIPRQQPGATLAGIQLDQHIQRDAFGLRPQAKILRHGHLISDQPQLNTALDQGSNARHLFRHDADGIGDILYAVIGEVFGLFQG